MEIKPSVRGELRGAGTAPTRKGSAAKATTVEQYIMRIKGVDEERSSDSGEAIMIVEAGLASPFYVWFGIVHTRDGGRRKDVYEMRNFL